MAEPNSQKPYLLRAIYEWCVDNGFTPYVAVIVDEATRVPTEYVRNGEIVLNVGPLAANKLKLGNEFVEFAARFGGISKEIVVPITAISSIYARENGQGMAFEVAKKPAAVIERRPETEPRAPDLVAPPPVREVVPDGGGPRGGAGGGKRPSLRRIK